MNEYWVYVELSPQISTTLHSSFQDSSRIRSCVVTFSCALEKICQTESWDFQKEKEKSFSSRFNNPKNPYNTTYRMSLL